MIVYIISGSGRHVIDCEEYPLWPGTLYFLRPDQVHLWEYRTLPTGYALSFSQEVLSTKPQPDGGAGDADLFDDLADAGPLRLSTAEARTIRPVIEEMVREYEGVGWDYWSVLHAYLHVLLVRSHRLLRYEAVSECRPYPARPLVRRFHDLVRHSGGRQQRVRDYSERLGITPSHLADVVREVTGRTPGQIIRAAQIAEAQRLLQHTDQTIAEIAYELGFRDTAYFGRFFKRETGVTPGRFRRQTRTPGLVPAPRHGLEALPTQLG